MTENHDGVRSGHREVSTHRRPYTAAWLAG